MSASDGGSDLPVGGGEVRVTFRRKLEAIDDDFVQAGLVVADSMSRLVTLFLAGDASSINESRDMAEDVSQRIRAVEDDGFVLIARESPVGRDLRRLVAIMRLAIDVDRAAALLRHVNETLERVTPSELPPHLVASLQDMADRATRVYRGGVDAWRLRDPLAVNALDHDDEAIDLLQEQLLNDASELESGQAMVTIGLLARYFERIADHGVAMAQDVAFVVTGERVVLPSKR